MAKHWISLTYLIILFILDMFVMRQKQNRISALINFYFITSCLYCMHSKSFILSDAKCRLFFHRTSQIFITLTVILPYNSKISMPKYISCFQWKYQEQPCLYKINPLNHILSPDSFVLFKHIHQTCSCHVRLSVLNSLIW